MTKEPLYIISGDAVTAAEHNLFSFREAKDEWVKRILSRPHNPEPAKAMPSCASSSDELSSKEKQAAINEERAKALKKLTRIQFMVKHAWEGDRDTNPPDLGNILKFVEGFIAELRQQSGKPSGTEQQQRGREE